MEKYESEIFRTAGQFARRAIRSGRAVERPVRAMAALYSGIGLIGNGGMSSLFESPLDLKELIDALNEIGMPKAAGVCREALAQFPNSELPADFDERMKLMASLAGAPQVWRRSADVLLAQKDELLSRVLQFLKTNRESFRDSDTLQDLLEATE